MPPCACLSPSCCARSPLPPWPTSPPCTAASCSTVAAPRCARRKPWWWKTARCARFAPATRRSRGRTTSTCPATPACPAGSTCMCTCRASRARARIPRVSGLTTSTSRSARSVMRARRSMPASPRCATSAATSPCTCAMPSTRAWSRARASTPPAVGIKTTGGHGDPTNGLNSELSHLIGPPGPTEGVINSVDDARQAVRQRYKDGSDVIKITATGGVLSYARSGDAPQFTVEEITAIVDHRQGLRLPRRRPCPRQGRHAPRDPRWRHLDRTRHRTWTTRSSR